MEINRYSHYWVWRSTDTLLSLDTICGGINRYLHYWVWTSCVGESTDTHTTEFGESTDTHSTEFGHHVWGIQQILTLLSLDILCREINRYWNYWVWRFNRYLHYWVWTSCVAGSRCPLVLIEIRLECLFSGSSPA